MTVGTSNPHNTPVMSGLYPALPTKKLKLRKATYCTGLWFSSAQWRNLNYFSSNIPHDDPSMFSSLYSSFAFPLFPWSFAFLLSFYFFPSLLPHNWYFSDFVFGDQHKFLSRNYFYSFMLWPSPCLNNAKIIMMMMMMSKAIEKSASLFKPRKCAVILPCSNVALYRSLY